MPRPPGFHRASTLARFFFIHIYLYDLFRLSYTIYLDIPRIHHIAHISPLSASIFTSFTPFYSFRIGNSPPRHTEPLIISLLSRQSYVIHAENIFLSRSVYSTHISSPSRPILLPENLYQQPSTTQLLPRQITWYPLRATSTCDGYLRRWSG